MDIREHVPLAPITTFRAGGSARYFIEAHTPEDVFAIDAFARSHNVPLLVIGGGSNMLLQDEEWSGVVLHMRIKGVTVKQEENRTLIEAGAGEVMDDVIARTIALGLRGLENLSWVPGTVGAAPIQNIGCYGVEISSFIEWVEVADMGNGAIRRLSRGECAFGYRETVFKKPEGRRLVVLRVAFTLPNSAQANVGYADSTRQYRDLAGHFEGRDPSTITPTEIREALATIRGAKFSSLSGEGTAGSFFKNPIVPKDLADRIRMRFPELPVYPTEDPGRVKLPAAYLVDHVAGMRGSREGQVGTSALHALAIVNYGGATALAIRTFAKKIITRVYEATGVTIEPEVVMITEEK